MRKQYLNQKNNYGKPITLTLLFAGTLVNKGSTENKQIHLYHTLFTISK